MTAQKFSQVWKLPWILLAIWSIWSAVVAVGFVVMFANYSFQSGDYIVTHSGRHVSSGAWLMGSIFGAAILGFLLGIPSVIASVILYFFIPRPPVR
jgi:hypothetical protein